MFAVVLGVAEGINVLEQANTVLIYGLHMEKVKLHLSDNLAPLR